MYVRTYVREKLQELQKLQKSQKLEKVANFAGVANARKGAEIAFRARQQGQAGRRAALTILHNYGRPRGEQRARAGGRGARGFRE